jgi:serine phosphatase RsbU (regulator of sigma subunit)
VAGGPLVEVAGASRPYPGESANGDAWTVAWPHGGCRIAVIDGLGHGPEAAKAARAAVDALEAHPELDPVHALALCDRALAGTRGAAISIAAIDPAHTRLTYVGIGNVEAQLWQPSGAQRPIAYRGIVGAAHRTVRAFELALTVEWVLLLHTDGVSARLNLADYVEQARDDLPAVAQAVLARWGRARDDATVVVARSP